MFRVVALDPTVDRRAFACGNVALDRYFRERVTQDIARRVTNCFVALDDEGRVRGFYTLASTSILLADLPEPIARRLPRYPSIPAVRLGWLAVDRAVQGGGLGAALLADALARTAEADIAAFALIVDAKDDAAAAFYEWHGFVRFASQPRTLYLPIASIPRRRR